MGIPGRITRQQGRSALVDGIPFALPVVCEDSPVLMAAFTIDARKAEPLLPGREIFPLQLWNGRGLLVIVVINYLQTTIGKSSSSASGSPARTVRVLRPRSCRRR
jgi:hypothetical protein